METVIVEKTEPVVNLGDNIAFKATLSNGTEVGWVYGAIMPGQFADIRDIEVLPEWRGEQFATKLFMAFVREGLDKKVKEVSAAADNERSMHLFSHIPGVKNFTFKKDWQEIPKIKTLEQAELKLANERARLHPEEPDGSDIIGSPIRVTAYLEE